MVSERADLHGDYKESARLGPGPRTIFLEPHPGLGVTVLCVDEVEDRFDPADEPFELVTVGDLDVEDLWDMALRYTALEFSMALKP